MMACASPTLRIVFDPGTVQGSAYSLFTIHHSPRVSLTRVEGIKLLARGLFLMIRDRVP